MVTWNLQGPAPEQGRREQPGQSFPRTDRRVSSSLRLAARLRQPRGVGPAEVEGLAESFAFANFDRNDEVAVLVKRHAGGQTR